MTDPLNSLFAQSGCILLPHLVCKLRYFMSLKLGAVGVLIWLIVGCLLLEVIVKDAYAIVVYVYLYDIELDDR